MLMYVSHAPDSPSLSSAPPLSGIRHLLAVDQLLHLELLVLQLLPLGPCLTRHLVQRPVEVAAPLVRQLSLER